MEELLHKRVGTVSTIEHVDQYMDDTTEMRRVKELIYSFWKLREIREILDILDADGAAKSVNLMDNEYASYFLRNCLKVLADDYVLSDEDMLKLRRITQGTSSLEFLYDKSGKKEDLVYVTMVILWFQFAALEECRG